MFYLAEKHAKKPQNGVRKDRLMLYSLIRSHHELQKELERAIRQNSSLESIHAIGESLSDLDQSIRNSIPIDAGEARLKLNYLLSLVADNSHAEIAERDVGAIEELFYQILDMVHDPNLGLRTNGISNSEPKLHS